MYWRLSTFYLFYFAALGALWPYWGPYLKSLGYNEREIGELVAIIMATKIVDPYVWGWIADHTGQRMNIVRLASLLATVAFAGVFLGSGYLWLAMVMVIYSFFWNASLPQFEATTMSHLGDATHRYSSIRLWGSVGFIITVAGLGPVLNLTGIGIVPWVFIVLLAGIWLASLLVPEQAAGHLTLDHEPIATVLVKPEVVGLLLVCFLLQASHGPYYTFYSIYLQEHAYTFSAIGGLWALGVVSEIGVFLMMHRLVPWFGERRLLVVSLILTSLRWLLIGYFVTSPLVLLFAQILHAASFGVYHAVAITLIHRYFTGRHQGRGQALYSSLSFGAGGALGSMLSGYLWTGLGAAVTFSAAALMSGLAAVIAWRLIPGPAESPH